MKGAYHSSQRDLPKKTSYFHFDIDLDIPWKN
jgi:hypothetical protein